MPLRSQDFGEGACMGWLPRGTLPLAKKQRIKGQWDTAYYYAANFPLKAAMAPDRLAHRRPQPADGGFPLLGTARAHGRDLSLGKGSGSLRAT